MFLAKLIDDADVIQIAIMFVVIESATNDEFIRDLEPNVI